MGHECAFLLMKLCPAIATASCGGAVVMDYILGVVRGLQWHQTTLVEVCCVLQLNLLGSLCVLC